MCGSWCIKAHISFPITVIYTAKNILKATIVALGAYRVLRIYRPAVYPSREPALNQHWINIPSSCGPISKSFAQTQWGCPRHSTDVIQVDNGDHKCITVKFHWAAKHRSGQCWLNVGPPSATLVQQKINTGIFSIWLIKRELQRAKKSPQGSATCFIFYLELH